MVFFFNSYHVDSAELQQRKLGDLAFLVQHYELAYVSYYEAKREFNNDHAWIYFAGALVSWHYTNAQCVDILTPWI